MKILIAILIAFFLAACAPEQDKPGDKDDPGGIDKPPQEGRT